MKFLAMIAAMFAAPGAAAMPPPSMKFNPVKFGRSRTPGKPGRAGDKLARMAAEGRLGMGFPK